MNAPVDNLPPIARNVICVDFDGTLFEWGDLMAEKPPFEWATSVMKWFKEEGYQIVIFTSRLSPTWWAAEGMDFDQALVEQTAFIEQRLREYDIPYDKITSEKVPAQYYIDDKAIEFDGSADAWYSIGWRILKRGIVEYSG